MKLEEENIKKHFLLPSALFADRETYRIDTILGSCISVCLFDPKLKIGGMNHYMLPFWNGKGLATPKYGNIATEKLIDRMIYLGASRSSLVAKVFGGANQMLSQLNVGERNRQVAMEILDKAKVKVVAESTGGFKGRKIEFNTATGEVLMKFLVSNNSKKLPDVPTIDQIVKVHKEAI